MRVEKKKNMTRKAVTLPEVLISVTIAVIAILGTMMYQYSGQVDSKRANVASNAARLSAIILENWKGNGAVSNYNPVAELAGNIDLSASEYEVTGLSNTLGSYSSQVDGVAYYITLSYTDQASGLPRILHASVTWMNDFGAWDEDADKKTVNMTVYGFANY